MEREAPVATDNADLDDSVADGYGDGLAAVPEETAPVSDASPILRVEDLTVRFGARRGWRPRAGFAAVDGVSLGLLPGTTLGVVGESGSGKSTLGRACARLGPVTSGRVWFDSKDITDLSGAPLKRARRDFQMIFQNPSTSLNPGLSAEEAVAEPLLVHGLARGNQALQEARDLLEHCGLRERTWSSLPRRLSGGQQQRVAIARALAVRPRLIIADEATSALDVSAQARVINLMARLQQELGLAFLFISHDLAVVRHVSHEIAVMYRGRIVEQGPAELVCTEPRDEYTKRLLSASPSLDPDLERQRRAVRRGLA